METVTIELAAALGTVSTGAISLGAFSLLKRRRKNAKEEAFRVALLNAIKTKKVQAVARLLLEAEKNVFEEERKRTEFESADVSPVHRAISANAVNVLDLLLVRGFSANSASLTKTGKRQSGRTWTQVIRMRWPEAEDCDAMRETALVFAVRTKKLKCARTLIEHGANIMEVGCFVEGVDLRRENALSYASKRGKKYHSLVKVMKCKMAEAEDTTEEKSELDEAEEASSDAVTLSDESEVVNDSDIVEDIPATTATQEPLPRMVMGLPRTVQPINICYKDRCSQTNYIEWGPSTERVEEMRPNLGPILCFHCSQYVMETRPTTDIDFFKYSTFLVRKFLVNIRSCSDESRSAHLVWLKNSLKLHHEMGTATYDLVKHHHSTVKSQLGMVHLVIRNRADELKFLKPSRLNRRYDGDELCDVDKACFDACVTFAQDNFTYLKEDYDLKLVLDVIKELAFTEIGGPLMADVEEEKDEWREALAAVEVAEAAEATQDATPPPQQEEWQEVRRKRRADKQGKKINSKEVAEKRGQKNVNKCINRIMTLEEYSAEEMLNQARKNMVSESDKTSGVETASMASASAWSERFQVDNESGENNKENIIGLDDVAYPAMAYEEK